MDRIAITHEDVTDPIRLRQRLDQAYQQAADLLKAHEALKQQVAELQSAQGIGLVTPADRVLLKQLATGSIASAAPAQPGLILTVETFADLPPTATAVPGQMVRVRATNIKYVFDGPTRAWVAW